MYIDQLLIGVVGLGVVLFALQLSLLLFHLQSLQFRFVARVLQVGSQLLFMLGLDSVVVVDQLVETLQVVLVLAVEQTGVVDTHVVDEHQVELLDEVGVVHGQHCVPQDPRGLDAEVVAVLLQHQQVTPQVVRHFVIASQQFDQLGLCIVDLLGFPHDTLFNVSYKLHEVLVVLLTAEVERT